LTRTVRLISAPNEYNTLAKLKAPNHAATENHAPFLKKFPTFFQIRAR